MPADPIINEQLILALLETDIKVEELEQTQTATVMAIVDACDRKLERAALIDIVSTSLKLHNTLGRIALMELITSQVKTGSFTGDVGDEALKGMVKRADIERKKLYNQMDLVAQCPLLDDKVH